jgi:hypothetical protein
LEKEDSARYNCDIFCLIVFIFDQVYKAYDLVELRTVALKIHELNSQWSEEKKVCKLIHFHFCLDNSFRQITCVMQRVKALFKKLLIIVASFDCRASSFSSDLIILILTLLPDTMYLNSVPTVFALSWSFAKALT